jgi:hypothetical protein
MKIAAAILVFSAWTLSGATLRNNDSCDIAPFPAATLLLPYFDVDINTPITTATTTIFTIINTSREQHIARVTIWTDLAYPVLTFDLLLTGYEARSINLYDVIVRGFFLRAGDEACGDTSRFIPQAILNDLGTALTTGHTLSCGLATVGSRHTDAIGFVTIDTVATCGTTMPNDPAYYNELLYDNVLTGDYEWIAPLYFTGANYAGGNPLVHIRAIPEGGPAGVVTKTNLPYTFYDLYTPRGTADSRAMDRRQPLPHAFIARYIQGGAGAFNTELRIWREGVVPPGAACTSYKENAGSAMKSAEIVRFDEHENPTIFASAIIADPVIPRLPFPTISSTPTSSGNFPPLSISGDLGGFLYLNLDNVTPSPNASTKPGTAHATQNWVIVSMKAQGRFQTAVDATPLANGCSPAPPTRGIIAPGDNQTP